MLPFSVLLGNLKSNVQQSSSYCLLCYCDFWHEKKKKERTGKKKENLN